MELTTFRPVQEFIERLESEEFLIDEERQALLRQVATKIQQELIQNDQAEVLVICTHNSRRSQLGELWLRVLCDYFDVSNINSYSGGTEATAFNERMVTALSRAGFQITQRSNGSNPKYEIHWAHNQKNIPPMFSKVYNADINPSSEFIAILVCDQADEECPIIYGAKARFFIGYQDPKTLDDTPKEAENYDAKVAEIGREMTYLVKQLRSTF